MMKIKKYFHTILFLSAIAMILNIILYKNYSVDLVFLISNYLVIVISVTLMYLSFKKYYHLKNTLFVKKIFWLSLSLRVFSVLFFYWLFYYITGTEFDVEAKDALFYHASALDISKTFYSGDFSILDILEKYRIDFDDSGYSFFLAIIYFLSNDSILFARIIQAIISAYSVILIFKIGNEFWSVETGKNTAIIAMAFPPLLFFTGLHLKETIMVFFILLFILHVYKIVNDGFNFKRLFYIIISIIFLFSLRTVLAVISVVSLFIYIVINSRAKVYRKILLSVVFIAVTVFSLQYLNIFEEVSYKFIAYINLDRETGVLGGRSLNQYSSKQSFAKILSTPLLAAQSIVSPYPSMVKTNISFFNQTLQWYYVGGLFMWNYISYFSFIGLYNSFKNKFRQNSILFLISIFYTAALVISVYILSIRYNIVKLVLLIFFAGLGMNNLNKKKFHYFLIYSIIVTIVIITWNYVKLKGRGLI